MYFLYPEKKNEILHYADILFHQNSKQLIHITSTRNDLPLMKTLKLNFLGTPQIDDYIIYRSCICILSKKVDKKRPPVKNKEQI